MQPSGRLLFSLGSIAHPQNSPAGVCFLGSPQIRGSAADLNMGLDGLDRGHRCQQPGRPRDALRITD